ncbi:RND family efflux transporter, MFP subunit [Rhizobium sp. NFR07]|uniref:efflux RND transporter periplasmic adaptor subunit n=1 Tax=Rhizobium sp. NFR07 TaxID=1566262 RepID=UPI0008E99C8E|nr:efflux RND transporter periplasmic adaptor subunit [Rhizobium sp. NFR07]SFB64542.1 RND family efflux transporter, MFP subunit [Rhizobium sp. NFR07]
MKKTWPIAIIIVAAGVAAWLYRDRLPFISHPDQQASATDQNGGSGGHRRGGGPPPVVRTVAAATAVLPMDVTATGVADADENTTIAAQEAGMIVSISAQDGDVVKAGDLIARLDDRTARAVLEKDKALLTRDQATLAQNEIALTRAQTLVDRNAGTQQAADEARAARDTAAATIESDKATIAADEIVVEHTEIRAPFDGRLGDIVPSLGAYLTVGATVVTIEKHDPIYVNFSVPEGYLGEIRTGFSNGSIAVDAEPQSAGQPPTRGTLNFFNNTVDPASGTILAKARFENADGKLWPGQSLNVTMHFQNDQKTIVVPTVAVSPGADQPFVFTVSDDKKVHVTPVTVTRSNGNMTAIAKGITDGAHVVVEGQVQLVDDATVREEFDANGTADANKAAAATTTDEAAVTGAVQ